MKRTNLNLKIGSVLLLTVAFFCILSFFWLPNDPNSMNISEAYLQPGENLNFLLGTDNFGRDILSRLLVGSRTVLFVAFVSVAFGLVFGFVLGSAAAIKKGAVSAVIMRFIDGLMAFPGLLLALMLITVMGRGKTGVITAISIFMIPSFARLVYSLILENENELFVKAAKSYNVSKMRLLFKHYLPLMLPKIITQFSSLSGNAIMIETSLSFLGLGIQPPNASWGYMLCESRKYFLQHPYLAAAPGIAVLITILGFNLLGDGINDALEKKGAGGA